MCATSFSRIPTLPEEILLLCMLHNIGATKSDKSLSIQEISDWTRKENSDLRSCLQKLTESGYVQLTEDEGVNKYHVTLSGIRKVLSIYS